MKKQELLNYCLEKNILLDNSLLEFFGKFEELSSIKSFLERLKYLTGKSFINKKLILENKFLVKKSLDELNLNKNFNLNEIIENFDSENIKIKKKINNLEKIDEGIVKISSSNPTVPKSLEVKDFVNYFKDRYNLFKNILENHSELENLLSINKISSEKQKISVIGMINSKRITKNGNLILEIEDLTGKIKILINSNKEKLMAEAEDITLDSVLGFKGLGNKDILFVNEMYFPKAILKERKKSTTEECALFVGDLHYGSKNFLKNDFEKFIDYLSDSNSGNKEASKIKYLFFVGDLVTGIGNYPNQENDLLIDDLEKQFLGLATYFKKIRKDIKIIITPGNHDCVRLMEPQPVLDDKFAWPIYELENVIIAENPSMINIAKRENFPGFEILIYHGFSYPFYAENIPKLIKKSAMNNPTSIMKYLLKNRHLAPTHGSTQYFPSKKDPLLIKKIPDIFLSGHTHKSGVAYYGNILIISVSSWEGITPYQEKFGNKPDHCKVPMFNLKTRAIKVLDFESLDDNMNIKKFKEKKENLKIAIDLDDTIWNFHERFFEYYNKRFGTNHLIGKYFEYSLENFLGIERKEVTKLLDDFMDSEFGKDLKLIEGAKDIILKLNEKHKIYFITARHKGLSKLTIKNLYKIFGKDFPVFFVFDENRNLIKEKVDYCLDKGIDILIDDRLKTVEMCAEKGIECLLVDQAWNKEKELKKRISRVKNWEEISEKIKEIEK